MKKIMVFAFFLSALCTVSSAGEQTPVNTVLILGSSDCTEVHIASLREAAAVLKDSRPELSEEVSKAADLLAK